MPRPVDRRKATRRRIDGASDGQRLDAVTATRQRLVLAAAIARPLGRVNVLPDAARSWRSLGWLANEQRTPSPGQMLGDANERGRCRASIHRNVTATGGLSEGGARTGSAGPG